MEEVVALDSSKQTKFVKSIKGLKKLIKENKEKHGWKPLVLPSKKDGKIQKKKRRPRGLVYLSHIPHGFYEPQMAEYFKQFGVVINVRVIRSKRTGNSKGCAFVEFKDPAVADIVSETMNNYLMGKRIIKAVTIPQEKQRRALRKHWTPENNPTTELRAKMKKEFNTDKDAKGDLQKARKIVSNLGKLKKKLIEVGVDYSIVPVDVPEELKKIVKKLHVEVKDVKDTKKKQKTERRKRDKARDKNKEVK